MRSALLPTRTSSAFAVAAVAVCALSLTACDNDTANGSGASNSASAGAAKGSSGSAHKNGTGQGGTTAGGDDCTLDHVTMRLQETGGSAPVVLLKLTNNGSSRCSVYGAPIVSDPVGGANLPVDSATTPQAVVSLTHGSSAYAAINLTTGDTPGSHRSKTLNITLTTKDGNGTDGHVTVHSPGPAGLAIDRSSKVTYWQSTQELAMQ